MNSWLSSTASPATVSDQNLWGWHGHRPIGFGKALLVALVTAHEVAMEIRRAGGGRLTARAAPPSS
jgi:hypothetical protein